ncbi:hypothetical protein, partial [Marimonas arenosa]
DPTDPTDPTEPVDPGTPTDPTAGGMVYSLAGPDAQLFVIDPDTGDIAPQDWFVPSYHDAWDQNEDHVYEITRVATPEDGSPAVPEDLRFETLPDGSFAPLPAEDPLMAALFLDTTGTLEAALPEEEPDDETLLDEMMI